MPGKEVEHCVLPLRVLAHQVVALTRAQNLDFDFLKQIVSEPNTPEFGGFNTKLSREQGHTVKAATRALYLPLIDMNPADPDTIMTAMFEARHLTKSCGQEITIFTNDQQLYKVAVNVKWAFPDLFSDVIPRLGGMHMLMSFVGCVGVLMANSGLEEIMKSAFGGVATMLTGKNFPQNCRALRMVTEEVLFPLIQKTDNHTILSDMLDTVAEKSKTSKLWVQNLVKPVLIMMIFVRAERKADWPLHLWAVKEMMPYFFSAAHFNYARYGLYYLRSMKALPQEILNRFMKGEHVMRHKPGLFNGMWSDMFIETTFMRYGHGPKGIVGVSLNPSVLKKWALSMHICSTLRHDVADMHEGYGQSAVTTHKEEKPSRIKSDGIDRQQLRDKLQTCIDPLDPSAHPDGLLNIITGQIAPDTVNADNAIDLGRKQMETFEKAWPSSFNAPLSKQVVTMAVTKKSVKVGSKDVYDVNVIYSRVLGLQNTREIDIKMVLHHELSPVPTSMFDEQGDMRIASSKSMLKKKLNMNVSCRLTSEIELTILDGCAILWIIHWPTKGTVQDYVNNFCCYIFKKTTKGGVHLVFDRYNDFSIKSGTRSARVSKHASRHHKLSLHTPLPPQKVALTVTENKVQLIDLICQELLVNEKLQPVKHKLVITGRDPTPVEVLDGTVKMRDDLLTTHEEADVIIVQQMAKASRNGTNINVVCDDTDVFVLLLHYYEQLALTSAVYMESTSNITRTKIDIGATVKEHAAIVPELLAAHALSGCDTVAQLYGIGKGTVIKTLLAGHQLKKLGDVEANMQDVIKEATNFIAVCYGSKKEDNMSEIREEVWFRKMGKTKITAAPELKTLPPTAEAFQENVKRAHVQAAIWKYALSSSPPDMDATKYGWSRDETAKALLPVTVPSDVQLAPSAILELIRCGCSSNKPCHTAQCRCSAARLSCSVFCACQAETNCHNDNTQLATANIDSGSESEDNE